MDSQNKPLTWVSVKYELGVASFWERMHAYGSINLHGVHPGFDWNGNNCLDHPVSFRVVIIAERSDGRIFVLRDFNDPSSQDIGGVDCGLSVADLSGCMDSLRKYIDDIGLLQYTGSGGDVLPDFTSNLPTGNGCHL